MIDTSHFKQKLEEEKTRLEGELSGVGRVNPQNPDDWEPTTGDINVMQADKNEAADAVEEYEARTAVEVELENRLNEVKDALTRIEDGTYGTCAVGGEEIDPKRLEANPAAKTCVEHMQ